MCGAGLESKPVQLVQNPRKISAKKPVVTTRTPAITTNKKPAVSSKVETIHR